jgi:hypothetical protein
MTFVESMAGATAGGKDIVGENVRAGAADTVGMTVRRRTRRRKRSRT